MMATVKTGAMSSTRGARVGGRRARANANATRTRRWCSISISGAATNSTTTSASASETGARKSAIEDLAPRRSGASARRTSDLATSATVGAETTSAARWRPVTSRDVDYATQLASALAGLGLAYGVVKAKSVLDTPSRTYVPGENTVGSEYDAWTEEQILEYYWGEHIHLGYYKDEDLARGAGTLVGHRVKDFIEAKEDFVDEMYAWSGVEANNGGGKPMKILDVGCGIGGATRRLASKCVGSASEVTGITLSAKQAERATALAAAQNIPNAKFRVMDALAMEFEDDSFDMVWACESGEHMPDKKKYVEEMVRVLKPGGTLVIATWCQRHAPPALTTEEKSKLQFLYDEWAHPYFISIEDYCSLAENTGAMTKVQSDDWTKQTIVSWRHSIWAGVYDPLPVFSRPKIWYKTLRDIICLERMRRAFGEGLMQYGMIRGVKK